MSLRQPEQILTELAQLQTKASVSLAQVQEWVRTGRPRPRFYPLVWLSRVLLRHLN